MREREDIFLGGDHDLVGIFHVCGRRGVERANRYTHTASTLARVDYSMQVSLECGPENGQPNCKQNNVIVISLLCIFKKMQ